MNTSKTSYLFILSWVLVGGLLTSNQGRAHDTWVETNTPLVRVGEVLHVDLKLGNHGNNHRDFKLAGRVNPDWVTFDVVSPQGEKRTLKEKLVSTAAAEKEGYWTTTFAPPEPGLYTVVQTLDRVMMHGKSVRGIRSAKALFVASPSLDKPTCDPAAAQKPIGLPFELVLECCPLQAVGAERPLKVRLLKDGKPLPNAIVSFVPRGAELGDDFDPQFERRTDAAGRAVFTPRQGNLYLIVAHHTANDEKSEQYDYTSYATTLTLHVPQKCACCVE